MSGNDVHVTEPEKKSQAIKLEEAILFYKNRSNTEAFATIHKIEETKNGQIIGTGTPVTHSHIRKWAKALKQNDELRFLPENVLGMNHETLIWWVPPAVRDGFFNFRNEDKNLKILNEKKIIPVPYPSLIFMAKRKSLYVFSTKEKTRPTPETRIYHAPLANIYENGALCWGNIAQPNRNDPDFMTKCEEAIFLSWSTHTNTYKNTKTRGGIEKMWDNIVSKKSKKFPLRVLAEIRTRNGNPATLADILSS